MEDVVKAMGEKAVTISRLSSALAELLFVNHEGLWCTELDIAQTNIRAVLQRQLEEL